MQTPHIETVIDAIATNSTLSVNVSVQRNLHRCNTYAFNLRA